MVTVNDDLISTALDRMITKLEANSQKVLLPPSEWMERYFWINEPRDPVTGERLPPGPIRLDTHQKRIIDEALSRKPDGTFKYSTIVYSAPKKSGKSAVSAAVALYMANMFPFSNIYCVANDGNQANDRLYLPVRFCIEHHQDLGLEFKNVKLIPSRGHAYLDNKSVIRAINSDAAGEAGSEPTAVLWSEIWGYTTEQKRRLWTELTIPSTKYGRAIRWVESYAGFIGVSLILWEVYEQGVLKAEPHPDFLDLTSEGEPVVWVNEGAGMFCYWDHDQRMIWQKQAAEFDQMEARIHSPAEYDRIYRNKWVSSLGAFIAPEWWDACKDTSIPPLTDDKTPVVLAVDASETNDCTAIVAVTRDPNKPETDVAVRACRVFRPVPGKSVVVLEETIGKVIKEWGKKWNIVCIAYDAYQMAKLVQDYRRGYVTLDPYELEGMTELEAQDYLKETTRAIQRWYYKFSQQSMRAVSDKQLYDMILNRQIHWNPNDLDSDIAPRGNDETLTKHIKQAGSSQEQGKYRIKKLSNDLKTDAAVALSMAVERCLTLILDNVESKDNIEASLSEAQRREVGDLEVRRALLMKQEQMIARRLGRG